MTIVEKILASRAGVGKVTPGDLVVVDVDTAVLVDNAFLPNVWREVTRVFDPAKIAIVFDHRAPAPDRRGARAHVEGREFARRFGVSRLHDIGRTGGISHVVVAEHAYALPGTVLICSDSHTCSAGALNCAARGVGHPDMTYSITTGKSWFRLGETIRYELEGQLPAGVSTKDLFLSIAQAYGDHTNQNVEYGGSGLSSLSIDARRTLATMSAELSVEFATFEADELLLDYIRMRTDLPFRPQAPDPDAIYADVRTVLLGDVEPMIALPDAVIGNAVPVREVAAVSIDQAFIGSCANGSLDDFAIAARVLAGRRVADGVRLIVTPGSQEVYRLAVKAGYVATLADAGAIVTNSTCGACSGSHLGILGPGETCITASTRNFKGRMGDATARIFMASPATVAAAAVAGRIVHPGEFLDGGEP
ncbi:MAG TPA: aconitase/3-isopropylmalate dehydratase large subunit family protein [Beijerinckiaceae bacterium]|nr:aconitase/3-isopropylmalate dehydratase large subunit family protein [Beijerinckiaceae bacterium]